jgi:hypothetical protein
MPTGVVLGYRKDHNKELLGQLTSVAGLVNAQLYCPLHSTLFALSDATASSVTLASSNWVSAVSGKVGENLFEIDLSSGSGGSGSGGSGGSRPTKAFVKFSPLLDPLKYVAGGYSEGDLTSLPSFEDSSHSVHPKLMRPDNSSYIDAATSAILSLLREESGLVNLMEFYGYYVGVKNDYRYMITDDIDLAYESAFFNQRNGTTFKLEGALPRRTDSPALKPLLELGAVTGGVEAEESVLDIDLFTSLSTDPVHDLTTPITLRTESMSSSDGESSDGDDSSLGSDYSSELGFSASDNDESSPGLQEQHQEWLGQVAGGDDEIYCRMEKFPCSAIFLEPLDGTLEMLMADANMTDDEWASALFQVTVTLAYLQEAINFTHNDLHTSNVMYTPTEKTYLCYKIGGRHYKVPTYGRIFKIIDFGRSIFEYKGVRFASDSFRKGEDAVGQYNCDPFRNPDKPERLPSKSFDLCRLACSMFDYFFEDPPAVDSDLTPIERLVSGWATDAAGKNFLYRSNGLERYPGFALYKMIARRARDLQPSKLIASEPVFMAFQCARKGIGKQLRIYDIDAALHGPQNAGSVVNTPTT